MVVLSTKEVILIMNKIKTLWNKICILFCSIRRRKSESYNDVVLLCFFGLLGDAIMFLDVLDEFQELQKKRGMKLVVVCRKSLIGLFQKVGLSDILYEELDRDRFFSDYKYFKKGIRQLNRYKAKELYHVRASFAIEDLFLHAVDCKRKVCIRGNDVVNEQKRLFSYFIHHTYDEIIWVDDKTDQLTRYGEVLKKYGLPNYRSKVYELNKGRPPFDLKEKQYIAVFPGASSVKKTWPIEKFIDCVLYMLDHTQYQIVLAGSEIDIELSCFIQERVCNNRILNVTGKTTIDEWFALIGNARMILCNESGAVHVAAALKVPSVCVGAQEFGDSFLPYHPELIRSNDRLPVVIRSKRMECYYCRKAKRYITTSGKTCYLDNGHFQCLNNISSKMVIEAINSVL